jgi:hypothetical protein
MVIVGVCISAAAFMMLFYVIIQKFMVPNVTQGWSTIMATMLLLGGIQVFSLGVIGLYLNIIFLEAKGRPRHIIKKTFGFPSEKNGPINSEQ